jgi:DNA-binding response OmpR family regulator
MDKKQHILLVEDDRRLIQLISNYLEKQDFTVSTAERGDTAVPMITQDMPDLVILDLMLPRKDGLTVCREVRHLYKGPILILTAREEDSDQVAGLEMGADDYVKKPVEPRVLLARIRALLRRFSPNDIPAGKKETIMSFGKLEICRTSRRVNLDGVSVELTSTEFDLLFLLAEAAGSIQERDHLFRMLKGREYDGLDRSVDVNISRLRKKLGDDSSKPFRIKTIWGQGYLFAPDAWS